MRFADARGLESLEELLPEPQPSRSRKVEQAMIEPESYDGARMERAELRIAIQQLNDDLGSNYRRHRDGSEMTPYEYDDWRRRATAAKRYKERRLIYLNEWIRLNDPKRQAYDRADSLPLARAVDRLVNLYASVELYLDDDSDEAWDRMMSSYKQVKEVMG